MSVFTYKRAAAGLLLAALLLFGWWRSSGAPSPQLGGALNTAAAPRPAPADVLVFVSGAVLHPGLYDLSPAARVADAIAMAGGMTAGADLGKLPDLAAKVKDGKQVNVPFLRGGGSTVTQARVDVNSATADELDAVPGMPAGLAQTIIANREEWGPFHSMSELRTALGLDATLASALSPYLSFTLN